MAFSEGRALRIGSRGAAICSSRDRAETVLALDEEAERTFFTRSFGWLQKTNLSFGLRARRIGRTPEDISNVRLGPSQSGDGMLNADELRRATAWYLKPIRPNAESLGLPGWLRDSTAAPSICTLARREGPGSS